MPKTQSCGEGEEAARAYLRGERSYSESWRSAKDTYPNLKEAEFKSCFDAFVARIRADRAGRLEGERTGPEDQLKRREQARSLRAAQAAREAAGRIREPKQGGE